MAKKGAKQKSGEESTRTIIFFCHHFELCCVGEKNLCIINTKQNQDNTKKLVGDYIDELFVMCACVFVFVRDRMRSRCKGAKRRVCEREVPLLCVELKLLCNNQEQLQNKVVVVVNTFEMVVVVNTFECVCTSW